jgi:thioredoxin 1
MFMMRNPIEDYAPVAPSAVNLDRGEYHHFSFMITEGEKQLLGYKVQPQLRYLCHFTSNRLILEPQTKTNELQAISKIALSLSTPFTSAPFYQISYDRIESLSLVRSLNLASYVKLTLKSYDNNAVEELTFVATPTPQGRIENPSANRSADFVELGNLMLQVDETFIQEIQHSQIPVLVYFWASGCKPCEIFAPTMNDIAEQFGDRIKIIKVNMDADPSLPMRYGVNTIPTVLIFKEGAIADKIDGAIPAPLFAKVLSRHLATATVE